MRTCRICGEPKPDERFEIIKASGNRRKVCRECITQQKKEKREADPAVWQARRRDTLVKYKYGMEPGEYNNMLFAQNFACAICKEVVEYMLYVDHCHDSLRVRGLLCRPCNTGLGMFRDNPRFLSNAIDYLEGR